MPTVNKRGGVTYMGRDLRNLRKIPDQREDQAQVQGM